MQHLSPLRFKQFPIATSIWKVLDPESAEVSFCQPSFIRHISNPFAVDQRRLNVPDYLMSFWDAWIIVGGYGSVIKDHGALIGQRLS